MILLCFYDDSCKLDWLIDSAKQRPAFVMPNRSDRVFAGSRIFMLSPLIDLITTTASVRKLLNIIPSLSQWMIQVGLLCSVASLRGWCSVFHADDGLWIARSSCKITSRSWGESHKKVREGVWSWLQEQARNKMSWFITLQLDTYDTRNPRHHYTDVQPLPDGEQDTSWQTSDELAHQLEVPPTAGDHITGYSVPGYRPPPVIPENQIPGSTHPGGKFVSRKHVVRSPVY